MWLRWVVSNLLNHVAEDKVRQAVDKAKHVVDPVLRGQGKSPGESAGEAGRPVGPCDLLAVFALGLESGGLVDRMSDVVTMRCATFVERSGQLGAQRLVVCETGVSQEAAARATADAIKVHQPRWVVSTGFAAALDPALRRGHILMADSLIDTQKQALEVGLQMDPAVVESTASLHVGRLLTIDQLVRHQEEKERLAAEYNAIACDMESLAVAQVCQRLQVRFLSVRIISDQLDDKLPTEVEHMLEQDSIAGKLGAATRALFQRPGSVKDMWKLRESALRASDRLAKFLVGVLAQLEE